MGIFASFFNKFMIHQSKDDENSCSHNEVVLDNLIINSNAAEITRTNIKLFCARAQDTAKIVNSTDDPAEFFDALNYMLDCLLY
ncbi:MAG: hypothetical protein LIO45_04995, partial [Clostridiales bacterium]|nr:hypothetical protein [Clostridiales bacterium]